MENKITTDINLQGNTILNVTLGTNNDMTKPGSICFEDGRIKYTDENVEQQIITLNDLESLKNQITNNL